MLCILCGESGYFTDIFCHKCRALVYRGTMTYKMTTIAPDGTRRRTGNSTAFPYVLPHVERGVEVEGDVLFVAVANAGNANGTYQLAGDKWLRLTKVNGVPVTGDLWMAYIHKGQPICTNFQEIGGEPPSDPPPPPAPTFPQSFTLIDPQGNKAEYAFVRTL